MCYAIALNSDKNSIIDKATTSEEMKNERDYKQMGYTPLIKAVLSGSIPAVELLILNGAKLSLADFDGRTPLHHATIQNNLKLVCLLLKRGADPLALDKNNIDPIQIATENFQPNIVTILRVAKMNNDLKEQDLAYSGDPMFDDILKDLLSLNSNAQSCREIDSSNCELTSTTEQSSL